MNEFQNLTDHLGQDEYLRARLQPMPKDGHYLILSDLLRSLREIKVITPALILDYGCGTSPYRTLFPGADYKRADFLDLGGLDYHLGNDSRVTEADAHFDIVLSTQVLEHVPEPQTYLSECFRLLKPGGKLFLTTHGTYEDHGCPYDFQRWTADGLKLALERAGFRSIRVQKFTTGPRALLFLMGTSLNAFHFPKGSLLRIPLSCYRRLFDIFRPTIHRLADSCLPNCRVVESTEPDHRFYLGLFASAIRES